MADQQASSANSSTAQTIFPSVPRIDSHLGSKRSAIFNMSTASSSSSLSESVPTTAMGGVSLQDDPQATPTPKNKQALSEAVLSTMTPPDSIRGAPLIVNGSEKLPAQHCGSIFVKSQVDDDVFGQNSSTTSNRRKPPQSTTSEAIAKVQASLSGPISLVHLTHPERLPSPVTSENAQEHYPPVACVFVANLATARADDQLKKSAHDHFDLFGKCYIKVKRDMNGHPFAIVQYTSAGDAKDALINSSDIMIDDRPIRCEPITAKRTVVLAKNGGGVVTADEAGGALGHFGEISQMYPTTYNDAQKFGLPEGMWVQFAYWGGYSRAKKEFKSTKYHLVVPPGVEARTRPGPDGSPMFKGFRNPRSNTDQKSIFVGNLPPETTPEDLKQQFSECGAIVGEPNIIHKTIQGTSGTNIFGFIEFATINEAETAANMEVELHGVKIRVEPKEYSARRHTRLRSSPAAVSPRWRHTRAFGPYYNNHNQAIPMAYNPAFYGLSSPPHPADGTGMGTGAGMGGFNTMQTLSEMSPYHHTSATHRQAYDETSPYGNMPMNLYATPPPSNRMSRHRNSHSNKREMMYMTGSPHNFAHHHPASNMPHWSPFVNAAASSSGYAGGNMMRIPEELEGHRY